MLSKKQLSYIRVLEQKSNLKFTGTTHKEMNSFVDRANQVIEDKKTVSRKVERENERFPFPNLIDDLPTKKQWSFIESLEEKTMLKFNGVTRKDAADYIEIAKGLLSSTHSNIL